MGIIAQQVVSVIINPVMDDQRQISSGTTVLWKYIFPGFWIPVMGFCLLVMGFNSKGPEWILFVLVWLIASGYLIWSAKRLKFVSIDNDFLYVADGRKQIQIPLADICNVKENFMTRPKLITLRLNHPSEFGTEIVFVPTPMILIAVRSHPIVEEIISAVKRSRSKSYTNL